MRFNPFETGLGLSTNFNLSEFENKYSFNPFETGLGLSTSVGLGQVNKSNLFQSL